jgi:predicted enzyme related to lactoylglutathione lyase
MPNRDAAPIGAPCWLELFTSDTATGRSFYEHLFGWTSVETGPDFGGYVNFVKDCHRDLAAGHAQGVRHHRRAGHPVVLRAVHP